MELKTVAMVLADISGYTPFMRLHTLNLLHAEKIVTDLMEAMIGATSPPLRVSKLEGDAVFFYAELGPDPAATAREVMRQALGLFNVFAEKTAGLDASNICICDSCSTTEQLKLKVVVHCGDVALKRVLHFEELAGENVILAHRLLKNSVSADEYLLVTEAFCELCPDRPDWTAEARLEAVERFGDVPTRVYYPRRESLPATSKPAPVTAKLSRIVGLLGYSIPRMLGRRAARDFHHLPASEPLARSSR